MLAHFPQCFSNVFYMLSLCYCKTSKISCCTLACGRLLVFRWTGQFERGQGACPLRGAQPPQLPVLLLLWRSLPPQVGRAFLFLVVSLPCCSTGLGLLLWCSETPCSSVRGREIRPCLPLWKTLRVSCFVCPTQLLKPSTGKSLWDNHPTWVLGGHFYRFQTSLGHWECQCQGCTPPWLPALILPWWSEKGVVQSWIRAGVRMAGDSSKGSFSTLSLGFLLAFSAGRVGAHVLLYFSDLGPLTCI